MGIVSLLPERWRRSLENQPGPKNPSSFFFNIPYHSPSFSSYSPLPPCLGIISHWRIPIPMSHNNLFLDLNQFMNLSLASTFCLHEIIGNLKTIKFLHLKKKNDGNKEVGQCIGLRTRIRPKNN